MQPMMKRILTGVVLIAVVLSLIFYAAPLLLLLSIGAALVIVSWEYVGVLKTVSTAWRVFWVGLQCLMILGLFALFQFKVVLPVPMILLFVCIAWLVGIVWLLQYPNTYLNCKKSADSLRTAVLLIQSYILVSGAFFSLGVLVAETEFQPATTLLVLLLVVWVQDSGAYFSGVFFGKHKLIPQVSPKKTWEGVLGGLLSVVLMTWVANQYITLMPLWQLMILTLSTAIASVFGDLFQSMLKRIAGVKDSGKLLPGHGGLFDRLDSLLIALPIFTLGLLLL